MIRHNKHNDDNDNLTFSNAQGLKWCKHVSPYIYAGEEWPLDSYSVRPGMERIICEFCFDFTCYLQTKNVSKIAKIIIKW